MRGRTDDLGARLRERGVGWGGFLLFLQRTESTNLVAASLAKEGAPSGTVVVAERQLGGRGRWNRRWESHPGGIYLSVVLRPEHPERTETSFGALPLMCAVAAAEALERATSLPVELRWPNDLYAKGRKIGGILCESSFTGRRLDHAIAGIGINANQRREAFSQEVARRATSCREILGRAVDSTGLAVELLERLESWWERGDMALALERFRELAPGIAGARIRVIPREGESFEASTRGMGEDGGLRVLLEDGTERVLRSEDVRMLDG